MTKNYNNICYVRERARVCVCMCVCAELLVTDRIFACLDLYRDRYTSEIMNVSVIPSRGEFRAINFSFAGT